jgi:hypothetical protein
MQKYILGTLSAAFLGLTCLNPAQAADRHVSI